MANLLATKRGRLLTFFLLYVTEGIPQGFTMIAIAAYMRRRDMSVGEIGAFTALLYLPWSWKWAAGPVVDLVYSDRLGRRRAWIVACQIGMALTLLVAMPIDFTEKLWLFNIVILVHNLFGAVQDVAIDALAVNVLRDEERGLGNGLMFAGAYTGMTIGGSGVLFLMPYLPSLNPAFVVVVLAILAVTVTVSMRLREPPTPKPAGAHDNARASRSTLGRVGAELRAYVVTAVKSMLASRTSLALVGMALLPAGAYALGLVLKSPMSVELGFSDTRIAVLNLLTTGNAALGCVAGGWLSDRIGRRKAFALFVTLMALPNFLLAWAMYRHGWVFPVDTKAATKPAFPGALVTVFWVATASSALFMGLMYGVRSALYMDLSNPAVAGTQFTAYMSLMNLTLSYSAWWQGKSAERLGYPKTLLIDAVFGLACLLLLPFTVPKRKEAAAPPRAFEPALPAAAGTDAAK